MVALRIILITALGYSYPPYLMTLKMSVVSDFLYVLAALVLEMTLFYLSVALIYATTEWVTVLVINRYAYLQNFRYNLLNHLSQYIPIIMYCIINTFVSCTAYKFKLANNKEIKEFFTEKWHDYVFRNDPFWYQIQRDVSVFSTSCTYTI